MVDYKCLNFSYLFPRVSVSAHFLAIFTFSTAYVLRLSFLLLFARRSLVFFPERRSWKRRPKQYPEYRRRRRDQRLCRSDPSLYNDHLLSSLGSLNDTGEKVVVVVALNKKESRLKIMLIDNGNFVKPEYGLKQGKGLFLLKGLQLVI
ncbi:unnamed protein product [Lactuca saligna]|uniref:Uncharacterized protein n=1 Tax=Lactuca saligna TaxID=75948 RepID=A0AA35YS62_LACSI|nr:unnamed protein product [Lactuca saligna]